ncbi:MAG: FHA domain-containing protein [Phycisphaerales bacterium]|nr:MAG: FHA domain-containing protein [Phycisphaerales bacterium]
MASLHVHHGPDKGRTYRAPQEPAIIGRYSEQIPLADNSTSRQHAEIRADNGDWVLTDLNSSNGTFLNGQRISSPSVLKHGDQIRIGSTILVFSTDDGRADQALADLVDLNLAGTENGSSILASIDGSEESVILQPPETADAVAAWNTVYRVAETVSTVKEVNTCLQRVSDILFERLVVDRLILFTCGNTGEELTPAALRTRDKNQTEGSETPPSHRIINYVVVTREAVLCANALTDERFRSESPQDSIHRLGLQSIICVPIITDEEVHGVIHLECSMSRHTYTHEQLRLVVAIARLTGMAIQNLRLLESRMRTERLAATGETVAYLSHHIRNILQGMNGGADVVELGLKKGDLPAVRTGWRMIRRNLDHTFRLAMNMLTFSKDRQPRIELAQLNPLVADVISLVQTRANEKSIAITADLGQIPPVPLDPDGIHQAVHNILINAVDASPNETGKIVVKTYYEADAGHVALSIADNGSGIPDNARDKIFEAFQSSKGHAGTGLGLAAARKIVDELRGQIEVDSAPDRGTTVQVKIPIEHICLVEDEDATKGLEDE